MSRRAIDALLCAALLCGPVLAQAPPADPAPARRSAVAEIEGLLAKIRRTKPSERSRLLDQLYARCGEFLDAHVATANPEELSLVGTTWLQLAVRAGDTEALSKRLKAFAARKDLPPDLERQVRLQRGRLRVKVGAAAPTFTLARLRGEDRVALRDLRGKLVLLGFWGSQNPGATAFLERKLKPLHGRFSAHAEFALVGVGVSGGGESAVKQAAFAEQRSLTWPLVFDADGSLTSGYGAADVPFLCLVGPDGKVLALGPGWQTVAEVTKILAERLAPPDEE